MSMKRPLPLVIGHYTMLIVLALLCVLPIVVIFATSLRQQVQIFADPLNFIFMPTLENYRAVLDEDRLDRYLWQQPVRGCGLHHHHPHAGLHGGLRAGAFPLPRPHTRWPTPRCCCAPCRWPCWPCRCS